MDANDATWEPGKFENIRYATCYWERAVRDWRWLWLRRRVVVESFWVEVPDREA